MAIFLASCRLVRPSLTGFDGAVSALGHSGGHLDAPLSRRLHPYSSHGFRLELLLGLPWDHEHLLVSPALLLVGLQSMFLGQVLTNPYKRQLREAAFHRGDAATPIVAAFVRRVGRPRQNWTEQVVKAARGATTGLQQWLEVSQSKELRQAVIMKEPS